jgi:hypothetical protein
MNSSREAIVNHFRRKFHHGKSAIANGSAKNAKRVPISKSYAISYVGIKESTRGGRKGVQEQLA